MIHTKIKSHIYFEKQDNFVTILSVIPLKIHHQNRRHSTFFFSLFNFCEFYSVQTYTYNEDFIISFCSTFFFEFVLFFYYQYFLNVTFKSLFYYYFIFNTLFFSLPSCFLGYIIQHISNFKLFYMFIRFVNLSRV